jgi:hypothetical protein
MRRQAATVNTTLVRISFLLIEKTLFPSSNSAGARCQLSAESGLEVIHTPYYLRTLVLLRIALNDAEYTLLLARAKLISPAKRDELNPPPVHRALSNGKNLVAVMALVYKPEPEPHLNILR